MRPTVHLFDTTTRPLVPLVDSSTASTGLFFASTDPSPVSSSPDSLPNALYLCRPVSPTFRQSGSSTHGSTRWRKSPLGPFLVWPKTWTTTLGSRISGVEEEVHRSLRWDALSGPHRWGWSLVYRFKLSLHFGVLWNNTGVQFRTRGQDEIVIFYDYYTRARKVVTPGWRGNQVWPFLSSKDSRHSGLLILGLYIYQDLWETVYVFGIQKWHILGSSPLYNFITPNVGHRTQLFIPWTFL